MKIAIGNDHAGYKLKLEIVEYLRNKGIETIDYGSYNEEKADSPIFGERVANAVVKGEVDRGIVICGTGIGISIAANKVNGIRAAVCSEPYSAMMSRKHNNSNILAFGARVIGTETAKMIVDAWLCAEFEGGRFEHKIEMIRDIEERQKTLSK